MEGEKLNEMFYKIPLVINVPGNKQFDLKDLPCKYDEFRTMVNDRFKITLAFKLEYMNDYGEFLEIKNQQSYADALTCTNGQTHYMVCREIVVDNLTSLSLQKKPSSGKWICPRCTHPDNLQDQPNCKICKYNKP